MLMGEIVPVMLSYLRNNPLCPERGQFEHVIVDEFQDLNRAEQVLTDLLAEQAAVTIIGDEDQSIYSFKHAHPDGIVTFADAHPGTHDETLNVCRRCPTGVVALANSLINPTRPRAVVRCNRSRRTVRGRSRSSSGHRWPRRRLVLPRTWCGASRKTPCPPGRF